MDRSPPRDTGRWRAWTSAGALVLLCWFLLVLVRPRLVRGLQSFLLTNRGVLALLPHGIATPRIVVGVLVRLGVPLAVVSLLAALLSISPPDDDLGRERSGGDDHQDGPRE